MMNDAPPNLSQADDGLSPAGEAVLTRLREHAMALRELHVASLELFGSMARGAGDDESDVDLLVEFDRPVGIFHFVTVRERLKSILGRDVDLVERSAVLPQLRDRIYGEAVRAA